MAQLNFTKVGDVYKAEFVLNSPTALHIEKKGYAPISLAQRSGSEGEYVRVLQWDSSVSNIDTDLVAQVYPKFMRVVTSEPVDLAYIVEG